MSQEKVNKYKEEKANRKTILKRHKRNRIIARVISSVIGLAIVGWIGYSIYDRAMTNIKTSQTEVDLAAVNNYISGLTEADTEEDTSESTGEDTASDESDAADNDAASGEDNAADDDTNSDESDTASGEDNAADGDTAGE